MIRIITQLDEGAVLAALRELAPKEHDARVFSTRSTFEATIDPPRLVIGYRLNVFFPPFRIVTFSGRIQETDAGTRIHGAVSSGWVIYVLVFWLVIATAFGAVPRYLAGGEYLSGLWVLAWPVVLFFVGRAIVRATQDFVVAEIGRAVRGQVTQD